MPTTNEKPTDSRPFNPLDKKNLGISVADALLQHPVQPLPPMPFIGAGIYAVYYFGDNPVYHSVSEYNRNGTYSWPIYVGKAVPSGARKGGFGLDQDPGRVLYRRLAEHAASIEHATNLEIRDFACRYLVVEDIWIPLGESLLVEMFSPVWNKKLDGFGNHDPGSGRYNQRRSAWDTVHPGRPWASKLKDSQSSCAMLQTETMEYITSTSPGDAGKS